MIESIYIKNFKKFERTTIVIKKHNLFIGENDSGKSTILQVLDIFFNQEKIDKSFVREQGKTVEIGIMYNGKFYKKEYTGASYKLNVVSENIDDLSGIKYIYIPVGNYDVKQMIQQLSIAKTLENTDEDLLQKLKDISQNSITEVIKGVDRNFIILDESSTEIVGEQKFKYDASLKFDITANGIPIEARGSGFQKNLLYALIIGNKFDNVILGIDEIENSFSINNAKSMIKKIHDKIGQTLITTHSAQILNARNGANIYPLFNDKNSSLIELLESLDNVNSESYILVEGAYDLEWIKSALKLLGKVDEYFVLPGGGCDNIEYLKKELETSGKKCFVVKDGDTNEERALKRECIELYAPLDAVNKILNLNIKEVPSTKKEFFNMTVIEGKRNEDTVKAKLSKNIDNYLTLNNPLIDEIKKILDVE